MPDTPNYDFLQPVLGDELYQQFTEKMGAAQGITLANIANGSYIPKGKYDTERTANGTLRQQVAKLTADLQAAQAAGGDSEALRGQIAQLTADLAARDKTIADTHKRGMVAEKLRAEGAHNPEMAVRLLDLAKVEEKDGKLSGLDEQIKALKSSDAYLFAGVPGARAGVMGGASGATSETKNQQINDMIRRASGRFE